jgi:hypothetical protein
MFLVNPWHRGFNTERIIPKESMRCVIQINSNSEELRPEEVHRPRIAGHCSAIELPASVGARADCRPRADAPYQCASDTLTLTQLHTYMRIMLNVADISRLHPMLCH